MPQAVPGADLSQTAQRATILAEAMAGTAAELRLLDPDEVIGYIRRGRWAEISDLVATSSELTLAENSLSFACRADFAVDWVRPPTISLDLEFAHAGVAAFFTLHLGRDEDSIELKTSFFAVPPADEASGTSLFAAAVTGARLGGRGLLP